MALNSNLINFLSLDVGDARIGVASANSLARIASPVSILDNNEDFFSELDQIIKQENTDKIIIGLPRNMQGEESKQAENVRKFADALSDKINIPIEFADETLSTHRAETEKKYRSTSSSKHNDDIAACYILEEYFNQ